MNSGGHWLAVSEESREQDSHSLATVTSAQRWFFVLGNDRCSKAYRNMRRRLWKLRQRILLRCGWEAKRGSGWKVWTWFASQEVQSNYPNIYPQPCFIQIKQVLCAIIPSITCDYGCATSLLSFQWCLAGLDNGGWEKAVLLEGGEAYKGVPSYFPYIEFRNERR